jgi:hypothetical protein
MMLLAALGLVSKKSFSPSDTTDSTIPFTSLFPSLPLVCPSNCGSGTLTLITAERPSRTSSPVRLILSFLVRFSRVP